MKKTLLFLLALSAFMNVKAQKEPLDSLPDYDLLFNDLAQFIDSITAPRSFTLINIGYSQGHFEYPNSSNTIREIRKGIATPMVGYYNKNGLGVTVAGSLVSDNQAISLYQTSATTSYDYLKNRKLLTGISYTHFFAHDSLPFYTSPLNNQVYGYFSYRGWWLKPAIAAGYGWGSATTIEKQKTMLKLADQIFYNKKGKPRKKGGPPVEGTTTTENTESIADLSIMASVKHDFYWLNVLSKHDYVRLTPQFVVQGGTQNFGLAQVHNTYISDKNSSTSILYNTEKSFITERSQFQLLSLSARLRTEFSKGIYFVQPQLMFDYYIPETTNRLSTAFVINAGILF
jgi:hypothetical protein